MRVGSAGSQGRGPRWGRARDPRAGRWAAGAAGPRPASGARGSGVTPLGAPTSGGRAARGAECVGAGARRCGCRGPRAGGRCATVGGPRPRTPAGCCCRGRRAARALPVASFRAVSGPPPAALGTAEQGWRLLQCPRWRGELLSRRGWRPGLLPNFPQCTGPPHITTHCPAPNVCAAEVGQPCSVACWSG